MTVNLAYQLFPVNGSHFDIRLVAVLEAMVALAIIGIWKPDNFTKYRW